MFTARAVKFLSPVLSSVLLSSGLVLIGNASLASFVYWDSLNVFLAFAQTDQLLMQVRCYFLCGSVASQSSAIYTFTSNCLTVFNFLNRWIEAFQEGTILQQCQHRVCRLKGKCPGMVLKQSTAAVQRNRILPSQLPQNCIFVRIRICCVFSVR